MQQRCRTCSRVALGAGVGLLGLLVAGGAVGLA